MFSLTTTYCDRVDLEHQSRATFSNVKYMNVKKLEEEKVFQSVLYIQCSTA